MGLFFYLEEALKTQSPQVVICDIYTTCRVDDTRNEDQALRSLINLNPHLSKWEAIKVSNYNQMYDSIGMFLNIPYTHTRYNELTREDFDGNSKNYYNGYMPCFGQGTGTRFEVEVIERAAAASTITEKAPISDLGEKYLRRICELCKKENISLIFINTPFFNLTQEMQERFNYVDHLAQKYGVPVLDGNKFIEEIGVVWTEDMYDANHLNHVGSLKYTKWIGDYVHTNYDLEDRSNDPRYRHWADESDRLYHEAILGNTLGQIDEAGAYLRELQKNEELVIAVTLTGKWEKSEEAVSELMRSLAPDWNGENVLLLDEGNVVFSADASEGDYREHFDCGRVVFEFSQKSGKAVVRSNEGDFENAKNGINFVVYDKVAKAVIDNTCFDVGNDLEKKS